MGYDEQGKQIKKTTTYRPPENVTAGKAEKLARRLPPNGKIKFGVMLHWTKTAPLLNWQSGIMNL